MHTKIRFPAIMVVLLAFCLLTSAAFAEEGENTFEFGLANEAGCEFDFKLYSDADFSDASLKTSGDLDEDGGSVYYDLTAEDFPGSCVWLHLEDFRDHWAQYALMIDYEAMELIGSPFSVFWSDELNSFGLMDCYGDVVEPYDIGEPGVEEPDYIYYEEEEEEEEEETPAEERPNIFYEHATVHVKNGMSSTINQVYMKPSERAQWSSNMLSGHVIPVGNRCALDTSINYHEDTPWDIYVYTKAGGWFHGTGMIFRDVEDPYNITIELYKRADGHIGKTIY